MADRAPGSGCFSAFESARASRRDCWGGVVRWGGGAGMLWN